MRYKLYIPGPCEVDEEVLTAMAQPTPRHYGPEWMEIYQETIGMLKEVFGTGNDLFMVPAVGHMGKAATRPFLMEFLFAVEEFLRGKGIPVAPGASMVGLAGG